MVSEWWRCRQPTVVHPRGESWLLVSQWWWHSWNFSTHLLSQSSIFLLHALSQSFIFLLHTLSHPFIILSHNLLVSSTFFLDSFSLSPRSLSCFCSFVNLSGSAFFTSLLMVRLVMDPSFFKPMTWERREAWHRGGLDEQEHKSVLPSNCANFPHNFSSQTFFRSSIIWESRLRKREKRRTKSGAVARKRSIPLRPPYVFTFPPPTYNIV